MMNTPYIPIDKAINYVFEIISWFLKASITKRSGGYAPVIATTAPTCPVVNAFIYNEIPMAPIEPPNIPIQNHF